MTGTRLERIRARIDRLPPGWAIVLAGFLLQLGLAAGLLALAYAEGDRVGLLVESVFVGIVVLAGIAALPSFALLWLGRYRRTAATLAALVGVGVFVVNEGNPTFWPFSAALLVAAVRAWARSGLDAATLLRVDPDRFERVEPPNPDEDAGGDDGPTDDSA